MLAINYYFFLVGQKCERLLLPGFHQGAPKRAKRKAKAIKVNKIVKSKESFKIKKFLSDLKNRHLLKNLLQKSIRQQFTELAPSTPNNRFELFAKNIIKI